MGVLRSLAKATQLTGVDLLFQSQKWWLEQMFLAAQKADNRAGEAPTEVQAAKPKRETVRMSAGCDFCGLRGCSEYLVNSGGGYGRPEMWACYDCMKEAEDGSKLAQLRDGVYAEDFS